MRRLLALFGVCALVGFAPSAAADPDSGRTQRSDDPGFLSALRAAGIRYTDAGHAIAFANAVCSSMGSGQLGPELVSNLKIDNPGLSSEHAMSFVAIAAQYYCPAQLIRR
ncbi:hypothetical protein MB901379_02706 [Mycobacterium basiliense]|uniref:DUF732 domain-containing protein n=1 Tax=Mycobacterium basiliense TaxID=2094119 RepID=A0A447GFH7_9MYCO|nr:DUF732 domain-containing protein [Mycobacterium basiliense]VDM89139.1 hypothetical protein MB901379_02706 [Mycobacterium basiliense]